MPVSPKLESRPSASTKPFTYISLFSGAGIGCYGFHLERFACVATVECLERRISVQRHNRTCSRESGYVCGDLRLENVQGRVFSEIKAWGREQPGAIDAVIATPPCQGMSVCNHKKSNEQQRNSLVVTAIEMVEKIAPKFFVFENTALFLKTKCTASNGKDISIGHAIREQLSADYHIFMRKVNLKNYGCPSSRTRSLVIGTRKNLWFSPLSIFPDWVPEKTLHEVIGDLPALPNMGDINNHDIYHSFKPYAQRMKPWVADLREGQGAFEQRAAKKRPHRVVNGVRIENKNVNGDKYRRQRWDAPPPCIHTRNDILASQNTIHPRDPRVFSIREVMRMMSVPATFRWCDRPVGELAKLPLDRQRKFLRNHEMNIRQCLGEAVPTEVMRQIAHKAARCLRDTRVMSKSNQLNLKALLKPNGDLCSKAHGDGLEQLMCSIELAHEARSSKAAYYTPPVPAFKLMEMIPDLPAKKQIRILEPSAGIGRLLHLLPQLFPHYESVHIDAMDCDGNALKIAKSLSNFIGTTPQHISINYIQDDFIEHKFGQKYDLIVGNPPFGKLEPDNYKRYIEIGCDPGSKNSFAFFMRKALDLASHVIMIAPKSVLNAPDFGSLRDLINTQHTVLGICDFGEKGFDGVKIETIALAIRTHRKQPAGSIVKVESMPLGKVMHQPATTIFDQKLPYWVIYRDEFFDFMIGRLECGVFGAFRDRQITKRHLSAKGKVRVLKSANVASLKASLTDNDGFVQNPNDFAVHKFINRRDILLAPNLSYAPRACRMPKNCIADGSVAILYPQNGMGRLKDTDVCFFGSEDFRRFYRIARNYGTRSLNIDSNSVFFFGVRRPQYACQA